MLHVFLVTHTLSLLVFSASGLKAHEPVILWPRWFQNTSVRPLDLENGQGARPNGITVHHLSYALNNAKSLLRALTDPIIGPSSWEAQTLQSLLRYFVWRSWFRGHHDDLKAALPSSILVAELELPLLLRNVQQIVHGNRDPCACNQWFDLYLSFRNGIRGARMHELLSSDLNMMKRCIQTEFIDYEFEKGACMGGAAMTYVIQMEQCSLEHKFLESLMLADGLFRIAVFSGTCLLRSWRLSQEQLLQSYADMVGRIARSTGRPSVGVFKEAMRLRPALLEVTNRMSLWDSSRYGLVSNELENVCLFPPGVLAVTDPTKLQVPAWAGSRHGGATQGWLLNFTTIGFLRAPLCDESCCPQHDIVVLHPDGNSSLPAKSKQTLVVLRDLLEPARSNVFHLLHSWISQHALVSIYGLEAWSTRLLLIPWTETEHEATCLIFKGRQGYEQSCKNPEACNFKAHAAAWQDMNRQVLSFVTALPVYHIPLPGTAPIECFERTIVGAPHTNYMFGDANVSPRMVQHFMIGLSKHFHVPNVRRTIAVPVLLIQRRARFERQLHGYDEFKRMAETVTELRLIGPVHMEDLSPIEQLKLTRRAGVLVGVYGAALTFVANMRETSALIELHSAQAEFIVCTGRWDTDVVSEYGGLALLSGHHHYCLRNGEKRAYVPASGMSENRALRPSFRNLDVELDASKLLAVVQQFVSVYAGKQ